MMGINQTAYHRQAIPDFNKIYFKGDDIIKLFYCYSIPLKNYLLSKQVRYLHNGKHNKTEKIFYVFEGTENLNMYLEQWKLNKN
jgi:hypothetical protein